MTDDQKNRTRAGSTNVSALQIRKVVEVIAHWRGPKKLTWQNLVNKLKKDGVCSYSRQALEKYDVIKHAFNERKAVLRLERSGEHEYASPQLQRARNRILHLEETITQRDLEIVNLRELIRRWTYNGSNLGVAYHLRTANADLIKKSDKELQDMMSRDLPSINRGITQEDIPQIKSTKLKIAIVRPKTEEDGQS